MNLFAYWYIAKWRKKYCIQTVTFEPVSMSVCEFQYVDGGKVLFSEQGLAIAGLSWSEFVFKRNKFYWT